jgi:ribosome-binding protein aMBF1 (putative translation factor)
MKLCHGLFTNHANSSVSTGSAGQNKQHLVTKNTAKLDRETEELQHLRVSLEVGKVIQQGRQNSGLTQKDLATVSKAAADPHDSLGQRH